MVPQVLIDVGLVGYARGTKASLCAKADGRFSSGVGAILTPLPLS